MSETFLMSIAILNVVWIIKDFSIDRRNRKTIEENFKNKDREINYLVAKNKFMSDVLENSEQGKLKYITFDLHGNMGFIFEKRN